MAAVAASSPAIVFCGFMAAGKSAAARAAAAALGVTPLDSDAEIERELGETIAAFFEREGEAAFRERERAVVLSLLSGDHGGGSGSRSPRVIALGGGALGTPEVREALARHVVVWCSADADTAWERAQRNDRRPLAGDEPGFRARYDERRPLYEQAATAILPADAGDAAGPAAPWLAAMASVADVRMVWADTAGGSYPAAVGPGATELLALARGFNADLPLRTFCVADDGALSHHRDVLPSNELTIEVAGAEASKTMAEAERVLAELAGAGARRDDLIVAFGGGVVGDLAGFCAASYQRGTAVAQMPTTVVAQVDSAYGGKTGVDLPAAKNYVGAFHQPIAVLADPGLLATLPPAEIAAGYAEVVKTALIAGGPLWERVRSMGPLGPEVPVDVIFECARTKLEVVAADERDSGRRAVLNLGHTVGHAIEAVTRFERYRHGEAVSIGLMAALRLSGADELRDEVGGLLSAQGLPTTLEPTVDVDAVIEATGRDKKRTRDGLGFVLLSEPGAPRWGEQVEADTLRSAVSELAGG